ncbi:hypothetical protein Alsa1_CDS0093 [Staphylococcus phage Alsa_1]|nr:hypothetical protein Alsa1_CDS0093 [Staphylococcus phage Alsa_1]
MSNIGFSNCNLTYYCYFDMVILGKINFFKCS